MDWRGRLLTLSRLATEEYREVATIRTELLIVVEPQFAYRLGMTQRPAIVKGYEHEQRRALVYKFACLFPSASSFLRRGRLARTTG